MNNPNPVFAVLMSFIFLLFEILVAAGVIFWVDNCWRIKPDGTIARLVRHRDRIWFALLLVFVSPVGINFVIRLIYQFAYNPQMLGSGLNTLMLIVSGFSTAIHGAVYGLAGCGIASPAKTGKPFSFWLAFGTAVALYIAVSILNTVLYPILFRGAGMGGVGYLMGQSMPAVVVILAFCVSRALGSKNLEIQQESPAKSEPVGELTFVCPHCSQHIACAGINSGDQVACPACGQTLIVPPRSEWWQRVSEVETVQSSGQPPVAEKGLNMGGFLKKALLIIATVIGLALVVLAILFAACVYMLNNGHGL